MQSVGASMSAHADKSEKRKDKFCSSADSDAMPNPFGFGWVEGTFLLLSLLLLLLTSSCHSFQITNDACCQKRQVQTDATAHADLISILTKLSNVFSSALLFTFPPPFFTRCLSDVQSSFTSHTHTIRQVK